MRASKAQSDLVFSGVFSMVWIGEAVVTLQIKLLGGNMYEHQAHSCVLRCDTDLNDQFFHAVRLHHRLHFVSTHNCGSS